jgi:hypothetical protein
MFIYNHNNFYFTLILWYTCMLQTLWAMPIYTLWAMPTGIYNYTNYIIYMLQLLFCNADFIFKHLQTLYTIYI